MFFIITLISLLKNHAASASLLGGMPAVAERCSEGPKKEEAKSSIQRTGQTC
jgi:hypothetical protein